MMTDAPIWFVVELKWAEFQNYVFHSNIVQPPKICIQSIFARHIIIRISFELHLECEWLDANIDSMQAGYDWVSPKAIIQHIHMNMVQ